MVPNLNEISIVHPSTLPKRLFARVRAFMSFPPLLSSPVLPIFLFLFNSSIFLPRFYKHTHGTNKGVIWSTKSCWYSNVSTLRSRIVFGNKDRIWRGLYRVREQGRWPMDSKFVGSILLCVYFYYYKKKRLVLSHHRQHRKKKKRD